MKENLSMLNWTFSFISHKYYKINNCLRQNRGKAAIARSRFRAYPPSKFRKSSRKTGSESKKEPQKRHWKFQKTNGGTIQFESWLSSEALLYIPWVRQKLISKFENDDRFKYELQNITLQTILRVWDSDLLIGLNRENLSLSTRCWLTKRLQQEVSK